MLNLSGKRTEQIRLNTFILICIFLFRATEKLFSGFIYFYFFTGGFYASSIRFSFADSR